MTDDQLIQQIQQGKTERFAELVRRYQDRVFNTCWRICGHLEDARDLTQDAFLKAFRGIGEFRRESGFYTWLFRIAVNLAISHRRASKRRNETSLDAAAEGAKELVRRAGSSGSEDPAELVSDADAIGHLLRALQSLDDDYRAVIVLRDVEGFDYRDIGAILEIPQGTVRSRLHRGRVELQRMIQTDRPEAGRS